MLARNPLEALWQRIAAVLGYPFDEIGAGQFMLLQGGQDGRRVTAIYPVGVIEHGCRHGNGTWQSGDFRI